MSAWAGKYVIGLTGNIATGKSVVRRMLEHLGAYGIDADELGHRAITMGSPGYQPVVDTFGKWILDQEGQIDRGRLGRVVFSDPAALACLESIIHPLVGQALDILIRRTSYKVIVIEAIKLIESNLADKCNAVWVTTTPAEIQLTRLVNKRGMSEALAQQRINAQPPQEQKRARATVLIRNGGSFDDTWQQVYSAWMKAFPSEKVEELSSIKTALGQFSVFRARPREAEEIARIISQLSGGSRRVTGSDIMSAFGEKAYLLLRVDGRSMGVIGWKVENLVARTDDFYLDGSLPFADSLSMLLSEIEKASQELQCEISLLFLPLGFTRLESTFLMLGYQKRTVENLGVRTWKEAAKESMPAESVMYFKQLRQDRVLKPV